MKVLVACEESQEVCKAFRERGRWLNNGGEGMEKGKEWTEADFRDFQSGKRLQEKINCMNALMVYRLELEKLEKLGLLKGKGKRDDE